MQDVMEFLRGRRTYRRFLPKPVPEEVLRDALEAARIASCGANRQTLKYVLVQTPSVVAEMNRLVRWAAFLPPEQGQPKAGETPPPSSRCSRTKACPGSTTPTRGWL